MKTISDLTPVHNTIHSRVINILQIAYEYLCRLEEARLWISRCVGDDLPPVGNGVLEDSLRNGVHLAKLAATFSPHIVQVILQILIDPNSTLHYKIEPSSYFYRIFIFQERRIFDSDQRKFSSNGLHFRHTDNINFFLRAAMDIGLPEV